MKKLLFYELMVLQLLRKKQISNELTKQDLYFGQHRMLSYIKNNNGCSQSDLANYLKITPASVATSTKRLEKSGFIEKVVDENNLRQNKLYLTDKGLKVWEDIGSFFDSLDEQTLTDISNEDIEKLTEILSKMIYNVTGKSIKEIELHTLFEQKGEENA